MMKEYSAISPSMKDQWLGKTLLICRRIPAAMVYRWSMLSAAIAMCDGFVDVLMTYAPRMPGRPAQ